jgi:hypothetical protein
LIIIKNPALVQYLQNYSFLMVVNNRPAYKAGRLVNALKGHFSRGTTVPVFTVFMDSSPIEDPAICGAKIPLFAGRRGFS